MSDYPEVPPVRVHIIADDTSQPPKVREIRTAYSQVTLGAGIGPQLVLAHAPNRIRAFIQVTTGQCFLATDQNAAKKQDNACANITQFAGGFYVLGTNEMWASSGVTSNIAVIQEFEDGCPS
jgi:hypothetical protein